jgi:hypothetical protein
MYVYYTNDNDIELDVVGSASMNPLNNIDLDYVAGWVMSITFEVASYGSCAIPMTPIEPNPSPPCEDAIQRIGDTEGNELYVNTIASGATNTQVIEDSTALLKDTLGTTISTTLILAQGIQDITAPDALLHIKKENDGTITNLDLLSNSSTDYIVDNNDISVNGVLEFDIHATEALDIRLRDGSNNVITPISVTDMGNHATIVLPTVVGAKLLKTGQTVSYNSKDDGDLEAGRASSFLQLASDNPFGNTKRFTDELGTETYTNNIAIDWTTYDGSTVLGYRRVLYDDNISWKTAIDLADTKSIGGFVNWKVVNITELGNIANYGVTSLGVLNYNPFNIIANLNVWCSTTSPMSTTNAYFLSLLSGYCSAAAKTTNGPRYMVCRNFTVTGTVLS